VRPLGRHDEASRLLSDIYGWFTEGFDTPDLKSAKGLAIKMIGLETRWVVTTQDASSSLTPMAPAM